MVAIENSFPWSLGKTDGAEYAETGIWRDFMRVLMGMIDTTVQGVVPGQLNQLAVTTPGAVLLQTATGYGCVDGTFYALTGTSQSLTPTVPVVGNTGGLVVLVKDFVLGKVRLAVRLAADGTATIPSPVQIDGTTWEIPLASFVIHTDTTITGLTDLRHFLPVLDVGQGADLASASTLTLVGGWAYYHVTGTTTITQISARPPGTILVLEFDGALTLTAGAALLLAYGASYTTTAGDVLTFVSEAGGVWREIARSATHATTVIHSATADTQVGPATVSVTLPGGQWLLIAQCHCDVAAADIASLAITGGPAAIPIDNSGGGSSLIEHVTVSGIAVLGSGGGTAGITYTGLIGTASTAVAADVFAVRLG